MIRDMLHPLKLRPVYHQKIWGGRNLARLLDKDLPANVNVGESWEVADESVVVAGPLAGRSLIELTRSYGLSLVGSLAAEKAAPAFPLLVKFIDAQDRLSVQVHPDDDFARRAEGAASGKTEMWYVVDAVPGAEIIHGISTEHLSAGDLARLARDGSLVDQLYRVNVSAGDVIFIPAGTVHAMGEGLVVCEVQQNCDLTYRLYDWNRLTPEGDPRELHVERAVAASRPGPREHKIPPLVLQQDYGRRRLLVACRYFTVELLEMIAPLCSRTDGRSFVALSTLAGGGEIRWRSGSMPVCKGESLVIPAALGEYALRPAGEWRAMLARIPDLATDVVQPLLAAGVAPADVLRLGGALETNDLAALLP